MNGADTAWMLVSTALVLLMTPALAFFYGGLVRSKNALNTMMMSFIALGFLGVLWAMFGYSLAFAPGSDYLGGTSWSGLLDKHRDRDPLAVDALIYLLALALQSPKPTATVALARGLSAASGPKRVLAARKAGLLPETEPGKPAGA